MNNKDIQVIEKVAGNPSVYEWKILNTGHPYYEAVAFPSGAERPVGNFYAEILEGVNVIVGSYLTRFYYEEDKYTWEQKYYSAIVFASRDIVRSIAFITSEDIARKEATLFLRDFNTKFSPAKENLIIKLYDFANRETLKIDALYTEFLKGE